MTKIDTVKTTTTIKKNCTTSTPTHTDTLMPTHLGQVPEVKF